MQIDWFTVGAQIVNFLVLAWLLKRFLYGPIVRAMDRREATVAARLADAETKVREAEDEAGAYRAKQADLERRRDGLLADARAAAVDLRRGLEEDARRDIAAKRGDWLTQLKDQERAFLGDLRRRAADYVCALARRALGDLANVALEDQIAGRLVERLGTLDRETKRKIVDACRDGGHAVVVRGAFEMSAPGRRRLTKAIHEALGQEVAVDYGTSGDIACGFELKAGSQTVLWSLDAYLDDLESRISDALSEVTTRADRVAAR